MKSRVVTATSSGSKTKAKLPVCLRCICVRGFYCSCIQLKNGSSGVSASSSKTEAKSPVCLRYDLD